MKSYYKYKKSKYSYSPITTFISPIMYWNQGKESQKKLWKQTSIKVGNRYGKGLIVDFGKEIGGYLCVNWGDVSGGAVRFYFSECLEELEPTGDVIFDPFFSRFPIFCQHVYRGSGNCKWRDSMLRGGFRYILIKPDKGVEIEIKNINVEADFYIPRDGIYPGFFECSDKSLNRIWYSAAYTMQVATKHSYESFVYGKDKAGSGEWVMFDGAKRDRAVWSLDLAISIPSYLLSLWNPDAIRDSLLTLLSQKGKGGFLLKPGYIPHSAFPTNRLTWLVGTFLTFSVYVLWWIRGVYFYYLHTGDEEFVKNVFGDIIQALNWFETQTKKSPSSHTPLFYANGFNDLSWDYTIFRWGFSGATNLVWAKTLEEVALLSEQVMGNKMISKKYLARAARIRKAVFEKGFIPYDLWDSKLGRFRHTTREDQPFTHEVNAMAILFDFVQGNAANKLLNLMANRLHTKWGSLSSDKKFPLLFDGRHQNKVMPFLVAFEVAALMKYGRFKEALDLTRRTWLPMLEEGSGSTFWEWYGDDGKYAGCFASLCHPWSAWILQVLNENLTGIKPVESGFSVFELNPVALTLCKEIKNLKFSIPTPEGIICGEWYRDGNKVIYKAELPDKIEGRLSPLIKGVVCKDIDRKKLIRQSKFRDKVQLQFNAINKFSK